LLSGINLFLSKQYSVRPFDGFPVTEKD